MSHMDSIFQTMKDMTFETTVSHQCGITMNDSVEARRRRGDGQEAPRPLHPQRGVGPARCEKGIEDLHEQVEKHHIEG